MDQLADGAAALKDLHHDLARKYRIHGPKIETIWKSFTKAQRTKAVKDGAADGAVLKHRSDPSLGNVCKIVPEWNLRDITEPGSDFLLDLLRFRATTPLMGQYGVDRQHILEMMRTRNLRHVDELRLSNSFTLFIGEEDYGRSLSITRAANRSEVLASLAPAIQAGACVPQATGDFILMRQSALLQSLNIAIEDILDIGSTTRAQKNLPPKNTDAPTAAMAKLSVRARPTNLSLSDLLDTARDQRASLGEYLDLLSTEPVVLAHAVNLAFFSRPELISDEKGRMLPVHTDRYISSALFEAVHSAVKAAAIWNYICRLLELLQTSLDKVYRAVVLQEISNTCHLEYSRTQSLVKRRVQTGIGSKYFRRVSNVYDNGNARVSMKIKPEELTRADPQLHYFLRLCQADTNASKAAEWLAKVDKLHGEHTDEREKLSEPEFAALCDHAVIVAFIQDLAPDISMPPLSRKKGQLFVSRSKELDCELNQIRDIIDLTDFVVPIDNLEEPGMAQSALEALEKAIVDRTGTKLGFIYEDTIEDCFADLERQFQQIKAKAEKGKPDFFAIIPEASEPHNLRVEQRRQKEKTRPAHSSAFEIVPRDQGPSAPQTLAKPSQTFKVRASTAEVFATLFDKSKSRNIVRWASFESAMGDLGFSVVPRYGSVFTFLPPESMGAQKSLTLHRPHKANIEEWLLPRYARRLQKVYGWGKDTFQVE